MKIYHVAPQRSGHIWVAFMIRSWLPGVEIIDLEGHDPFQIKRTFKENLRKGVIVVQTRDLLNWYASYTKGIAKFRVGAIPTWETISDEYYHPLYFNTTLKVVRIMYDDFKDNRKYRQEICKQLRGAYNEEELNYVPDSGHGSSFNGLEYQGRGKYMETLTRYKQVSKKVFVELFRNRPFLKNFYLEHCTDNEKIEFVKSLEL